MSRWRTRIQRKDPLEICGGRHTNATLEYHECLCGYDYRNSRSYQDLKFKHCVLADEMRRIDNFTVYVIIAAVIGVVAIFTIAAFCSCKWYLQTNDNPCSCFSCCRKKKKRNKKENEDSICETPRVLEADNANQAWTPMHLSHSNKSQSGDDSPVPNYRGKNDNDETRSGICMKFCMSDPVQDCCEFFDCDILWQKKNIYTIPIFGKRRQAPLQRRPTRPAPPPPKPPIPPVVRYPEPMFEGYDGFDVEPIPEAPPSPEPVRTDQPRAMYVDPLSFLQRPFLKTSKDKSADDEPDALYSKVKEFVFGKKKSGSIASLNKLGVTKSPDAISTTSSKKSNNSKYGRTGSLASLHNLSDEQLDKSYQNKRSMSLASLHMVEEEPSHVPLKGPASKLLGRIKGSLQNIREDGGSHSLKTDEYIDLEEMNKRIEAKMLAAQGSISKSNNINGIPKPSPNTIKKQGMADSKSVAPRPNCTPNFIPASAYANSPNMKPTSNVPSVQLSAKALENLAHGGSYQPILSPDAQYGTTMKYDAPQIQYYPPIPATHEKPAIPARTAVGTIPISGTGTLGRPKPVVPPRPPGSMPSSPQIRGPHSPPTIYIPSSPRIQGANSPRIYSSNAPKSPGRISPRSCGSNSPKPRAPQPPSMGTMGRHGPVTKPTAPPPPPPVTVPIESSL